MTDTDTGADIGDDGGDDAVELDGSGKPIVTPAAESTDDDDAKLGDAGKNALKTERAARRAAERASAESAAELQKLRDAVAGKKTGDKEVDKAADEAAGQWQSVAVVNAGKTALREAGFIGDKAALAKAVKMLDTSDMEFDPDTGEADGLDDEIEDFKKSFPTLFKGADDAEDDKPAKVVPRVRRASGAPVEKKLSSTERAANVLLGK